MGLTVVATKIPTFVEKIVSTKRLNDRADLVNSNFREITKTAMIDTTNGVMAKVSPLFTNLFKKSSTRFCHLSFNI